MALGVAPAEKFSVVRLGIELAERTQASAAAGAQLRRLFGIPDDRFVVGWIGRMTAVKRLPLVLAAFRALLDRGVRATLCLVGEGPDGEATEALAHRLGIMRDCLFVGYQRDVAPYYELFDALVLPSANREPLAEQALPAPAASAPVRS